MSEAAVAGTAPVELPPPLLPDALPPASSGSSLQPRDGNGTSITNWAAQVQAHFEARGQKQTGWIYAPAVRRFEEWCQREGLNVADLPPDALERYLAQVHQRTPDKTGNLRTALSAIIDVLIAEYNAPFTQLRVPTALQYPRIKKPRRRSTVMDAAAAPSTIPASAPLGVLLDAPEGTTVEHEPGKNGAAPAVHVHVDGGRNNNTPRNPPQKRTAPASTGIVVSGVELPGPNLRISHLDATMGAEVYFGRFTVQNVKQHGGIEEFLQRIVVPRLRLPNHVTNVVFVIDDMNDKLVLTGRQAQVSVAVDLAVPPPIPVSPAAVDPVSDRLKILLDESRVREEQFRAQAAEEADARMQQQLLDLARREQDFQQKQASMAATPPPPMVIEPARQDPSAAALASVAEKLVEKLDREKRGDSSDGVSILTTMMQMQETRAAAERDRDERERRDQRDRDDRREREIRDQRDREEKRAAEAREADRKWFELLIAQGREERQTLRDEIAAMREEMKGGGGGGVETSLAEMKLLYQTMNEMAGGGAVGLARQVVNNLPQIISSFKAGKDGQPLPLAGLPEAKPQGQGQGGGAQQNGKPPPIPQAAIDAFKAVDAEVRKDEFDAITVADGMMKVVDGLGTGNVEPWVSARKDVYERLKGVETYEDIYLLMKQVWLIIHLAQGKPERRLIEVISQAVHMSYSTLHKRLFNAEKQLEDFDRWSGGDEEAEPPSKVGDVPTTASPPVQATGAAA